MRCYAMTKSSNRRDFLSMAAGAAAVLAAKNGTTPLKLPLSEIHNLLREHGAIIPA